MIHAAGYCVGW